MVEDGVYRLMLTSADGQNLEMLFTCTAVCRHPVWSNDGQRIGIVDGEALVIVEAETGTSERTAADFGTYDYNVQPAWTTDLRQVVFAARSDMRNVLRFVDMDTGTTTEIDTVAQGAFFPAWLRDGVLIAYASGGSVYTMELETQEAQPLTPERIAYDQPIPAPDGKHLLLRRIQRDHPGLDVLDLQTGEIEPLLDGIIGVADWSPHGDCVAFTRWTDGIWSLGVVSLEGAQITILAADVVAGTALDWSPDGRWLAYISADPENTPFNALFVAAADGHTEPERIVPHISRTGDPFASVAWQPKTEEEA
jgi:Tol biopolymer transport system component